jgi:hypothetical protein
LGNNQFIRLGKFASKFFKKINLKKNRTKMAEQDRQKKKEFSEFAGCFPKKKDAEERFDPVNSIEFIIYYKSIK